MSEINSKSSSCFGLGLVSIGNAEAEGLMRGLQVTVVILFLNSSQSVCAARAFFKDFKSYEPALADRFYLMITPN